MFSTLYEMNYHTRHSDINQVVHPKLSHQINILTILFWSNLGVQIREGDECLHLLLSVTHATMLSVHFLQFIIFSNMCDILLFGWYHWRLKMMNRLLAQFLEKKLDKSVIHVYVKSQECKIITYVFCNPSYRALVGAAAC